MIAPNTSAVHRFSKNRRACCQTRRNHDLAAPAPGSLQELHQFHNGNHQECQTDGHGVLHPGDHLKAEGIGQEGNLQHGGGQNQGPQHGGPENLVLSLQAEHGAYMARGVHGQAIYIDPTAEMVIARFSSAPNASNKYLDPTSLPAYEAVAEYLMNK